MQQPCNKSLSSPFEAEVRKKDKNFSKLRLTESICGIKNYDHIRNIFSSLLEWTKIYPHRPSDHLAINPSSINDCAIWSIGIRILSHTESTGIGRVHNVRNMAVHLKRLRQILKHLVLVEVSGHPIVELSGLGLELLEVVIFVLVGGDDVLVGLGLSGRSCWSSRRPA